MLKSKHLLYIFIYMKKRKQTFRLRFPSNVRIALYNYYDLTEKKI